MTNGLQPSGTISIGDVSVELLKSYSQTSLNDGDLRTLFGVPSGTISLTNGYGKRWVYPGAANYGYTGGVQYFTVPRYEYLTVQLWAGGGGSAGSCGNDGFAYGYCGGAGGNGGGSSFDGVWADGGEAGQGGGQDWAGRSGNGGGGGGGSVSVGGAGNGGPPGSNYGGGGGYVTKTWRFTDAGAPGYGAYMAVNVGGGGGGGPPGENAGWGNGGGNGRVYFSWS